MDQRTMLIVTVVLGVVLAFLTIAILAGLYLTGGETYEVPVAASSLTPNTEIRETHLETKEVEEEPASGVITSSDQIVGKIAAKSISQGSRFQADDLRNVYLLIRSKQSIGAGNRIQPEMVEVVESQDAPQNALSTMDQVEGKMVRQSIPADSIIESSDIYQSEKDVVVASQEISANSIIREDKLRVVSKPDAPSDAMTQVDKVVGRSARRSIQTNEVVQSSDLFPRRQQLSYFIPLYRRAVTIPVSNYNNVSYMLRPGDKIDLYVYLNEGLSGRMDAASGGINISSSATLQKVADAAEIVTLNDVFTQNKIEQIESGGKKKQGGKFTYQKMTLAVTLLESEKLNLIRGMRQSGEEDMRFFVILRPRQSDSQFGNRSVNTLDIFDRSLGRKHREVGERIMGTIYEGGEQQTKRKLDSQDVLVIQGSQKEHVQVPKGQ